MRHPFTIYDLRFTIRKKSAASVVGNHQSSIVNHKSQQGVALIITLILLSVVTFMAITFLALSRRERSAVTTVTDTAGARLAADAALANAEAQIIANVLSTTNPFNFGLLVSTNYINAAGFVSGVSSFNNVNYQYPNGNSLNQNDFLQNLTNLYYSPRPPVFIPTNSAGANDFRFYLDLNRNARFDANGWVTNYDNAGNVLYDASGSATNFQVGDPEWIGVLERPDAPYGPNNKFIARYAFIAVPVGNTLDLNAIHNQVFDENDANTPIPVNPPPAVDGYFRNQGVGSWEINLAAFLADLNYNQWGQVIGNAINGITKYYYYQLPSGDNQGFAFSDARALLAYRYNNNYLSLASVDTLFGGTGPGDFAFRNDNIDGYSDGPLQTGFSLSGENDNPKLPWAGADNTNHFFTHQELFDPNTTTIGVSAAQVTAGNYFGQRLLNAGTNQWGGTTVSTYDRYTFYRLLSQLGTDSTPESGKMNLNYDNLDPFVTVVNRNTVTNSPASTNFMAWTPLGFFTNAADRLLRAYTTQWRNGNPTNFATTFYSVTNFNFVNSDQWTNYPAFGLSGARGVIPGIPVLVSNQFVYSSAINRLLQLAANIYDAMTNNTAVMGKNYPTVFRPLFSRDVGGLGTNVFITGYTNVPSVLGTGDFQLAQPFDASVLATMSGSVTNTPVNVYGVPWIIGAKKGFPSFNKFMLESAVQITRKLEVIKPTLGAQVSQYTTNQMYIFSITNYFGAQLWNSYNTNYISPFANPNAINVMLRANIWMMLATNSPAVPLLQLVNIGFTNTIPSFTTWPGTLNSIQPNQGSFFIPLNGLVIFITNSVYYYGGTRFIPEYLDPSNYLDTGIAPLPQFYLFNTNRLQVVMLDGSHVIDYVQLNGLDNTRNLNAEIADPDDYGLWSTNLNGGIPQGVINQILTSSQGGSVPTEDMDAGVGGNWSQTPIPGFNGTLTHAAEQAYFSAFFNTNHLEPYSGTPSGYISNVQTSAQAPFTPTRTMVQHFMWAANDPLVHYLTSDLTDLVGDTNGSHIVDWPNGLTNVSDRYMPWEKGQMNAPYDNNPCNFAYKDPLVYASDDWDFPANKFPTVGWLGRVHRGTPWQTVYLKATNILNLVQTSPVPDYGMNTWELWTGDTQLTYGQYFDAINSAPVEDRLLFDLFTTAFNDNATRGQLSVNQSAGSSNPLAGLAAWSALFSGVEVLSNSASYTTTKNRQLIWPRPVLSVAPMPVQPAGAAGSASSLGMLVPNINYTRANFTNADGLVGTFEHAGDILAVPALTEQSPFLNRTSSIQLTNANDEIYEWLPQQTMSLLRRSDSPRYVIYCYGQALKPAPDSVYTGGGLFFGMVTNYQIVSEIATRAVVRFGSTLTNIITPWPTNIAGITYTNWASLPVVTNNNAVIESFNLLPPD